MAQASGALARLREAIEALDTEGLLSSHAISRVVSTTLGKLSREEDEARRQRFERKLFRTEGDE